MCFTFKGVRQALSHNIVRFCALVYRNLKKIGDQKEWERRRKKKMESFKKRQQGKIGLAQKLYVRYGR